MFAYVVLPLEPCALAEREVAALAAEAPEDPARSAAHLVGGPRVAGGDEQVAVAAVHGGNAHELAVRRVENDPLPVPEAVHDLALPPCQHRLPAIQPDLEVGHSLVGDRMEPDELAGVVEDHRTALSRPRGRS